MVVPILLAMISVYLVLVPIISNPAFEYLFVLGFVILGIIVYVPFVILKWRLPMLKELTLMTMYALNLSEGGKNL